MRPGRGGFVLIFALWVLGLLTVLAVSLAAGVRQKILLVHKLDEHSRMHFLLQGAAAQAKAYLRQAMAKSAGVYDLQLKVGAHNNPAVFARIALGQDDARISYAGYDNQGPENFGVVDEERKINLNTTNEVILERLLERVLPMRTGQAQELARALLDWRQTGENELTGFYSEDYYSNLQYPYPKKSADYEVLDELLLVKGMTKDIYKAILPYVTIYGGGQVNINTAPAAVLYALGLDDSLISKILAVRSGKDGIEDTADDFIFTRAFDVASDVNSILKLDPQEMRAIDALNLQRLLTVNSSVFSIQIQGHLGRSLWDKNALMVFSPSDNRVLYWKEK